jgi:hypothetical protein
MSFLEFEVLIGGLILIGIKVYQVFIKEKCT